MSTPAATVAVFTMTDPTLNPTLGTISRLSGTPARVVTMDGRFIARSAVAAITPEVRWEVVERMDTKAMGGCRERSRSRI
jgi:hypothetical protein